MKLARRALLTKSSLLLSSMAVSPFLKNDVLEKMAQLLVPEAKADTPSKIRYSIEVCIRAGFPFQEVFPSKGHTDGSRAKETNINAKSNEIMLAGDKLFLCKRAQALAKHADNIAFCDAVSGYDLHAVNWSTRMGGEAMPFSNRDNIPPEYPASPNILFTHTTPTSAVIPGVSFYCISPAATKDSLNKFTPHMMVQRPNDFVNLFQGAKLQMSTSEISSVLQATSSLNQKAANSLEKEIKGMLGAKADTDKATQLMLADYGNMVTRRMDEVYPKYVTQKPFTKERHTIDPEEALALSVVAFEYGLLKSSVVHFSSDDWHDRFTFGTSSEQAAWSQYMGNLLDILITHLKTTPDPQGAPGESLFDNTLISLTSEFSREQFVQFDGTKNDNGDSGKQSFCFIGGRIKGGTYGDMNNRNKSNEARMAITENGELYPGTGGIPTGSLVRRLLKPEIVWATHCWMLGVPESEIRAQGVNAAILKDLLIG